MSAPYFLVDRVELRDGAAAVDGRLGEAAIRKGHVFSRSFDDTEAWRKKKREFHPCRFVLSGIEAYRHRLDELSGGLTARLYIEGDGLDVLRHSKVLE